MTKFEAAVISAYTGILIGSFADFHGYVESVMKRPVWTHELGNEEIAEKIKNLSKPDFMNLKVK